MRSKHHIRKFFCKISFADTCRSQEHKHAYRFIRISHADAVTLYTFHYLIDNIILTDDLFFQFIGHITELVFLRPLYALHGNAGHIRDNFSHICLGYGFPLLTACLDPFLIHCLQFLFKLCLFIPQSRSLLKILIRDSLLLFFLNILYFLFFIDNVLRYLRILDLYF